MKTTFWQLQPTCSVRHESFGLLFYDFRGPKLLFAETGSQLSTEFFSDATCQAQALAQMNKKEHTRITSFIKQMTQKGFLHEQSIC